MSNNKTKTIINSITLLLSILFLMVGYHLTTEFISNKKSNLKNNIVTEELKPAFDSNNISVAFASDNNYVKYLSVAIVSLTDNMSKDYNYDIVILEDNIKDKSKRLLLEQVKDFKNVSLRFIDINKYFKRHRDIKFYSPKTISYITRSMYNRLFIPEIFNNYKKVLYLDVDILINDSLVELYNADLKNYLIGGIRHSEFYNITPEDITKTKDERIEKLLNINNYLKYDYINSGVILYNIKSCNKYDFLSRCLEFIKNHNDLLYPDQDTINSICLGKIKYMDFEYNFDPDLFYKLAKEAKIFHFYGGSKPWASGGFNGESYYKAWVRISFRSPFSKGKKQRLLKAHADLIRYKICSKIYRSKKRVSKYKRKIENTKNLIEFIKNIE